ncbi:MAG: TIR domain-containing protein [Thauera sp.]|nr:TIR domain-containing protein [Thauera sp.]HNB06336.1 TIR domain-containing protein [Thauera aminoaromatica]
MEPVDLFYSYAHEDEKLRDELDGHLALLRRKGVIRPWHDRGIVPGQEWDKTIDEQLAMADLILLLVSMDFLNSDYIWGKELATAIERARRGDASVIPVLLRAVDLEDAPFAHLQGLPTDLRPVTSWPNRDEAWTDVAKGIRRAVEAIRQRWASAPPPAPPPAAPPETPSVPRASGFGTAVASVPLPEEPVRTLEMARPAPRMAATRDARTDALLERTIAAFANELALAARIKGVQGIGSGEAEGLAEALIDMPAQKRVLWVDDRPENNRHELAALAKLQVEVVNVRSTGEAIACLDADEEGFDLILSDWDRAEPAATASSAGLELLRMLAARPRRPPVIFYHAEFDPSRRAARRECLLRAGAFGEAVRPGELLALIRSAFASD